MIHGVINVCMYVCMYTYVMHVMCLIYSIKRHVYCWPTTPDRQTDSDGSGCESESGWTGKTEAYYTIIIIIIVVYYELSKSN